MKGGDVNAPWPAASVQPWSWSWSWTAARSCSLASWTVNPANADRFPDVMQMLCRNPFVKGMHAYPCGQCMPCRFNRRRMWTHRIMLEALQHGDNAFVTLTYDDDHLPAGGSLDAKHLQDWLKRIRKAIEPLRVRYYAVGEYGDVSERPHYHLALFGFPTCRFGRTSRFDRSCCQQCDLVKSTWGKGHILLGSLETNSAQYIAGYVTKKMTRPGDERLRGRYPEFCRMSLRPGIGADALHEVASELLRLGLESSQADVPSGLRHGSRILPLGRYLRRRLRALVGRDERAPEEVIHELQKDVRALYEVASGVSPGKGLGEVRRLWVRDQLSAVDDGKVANMEARQRLFKAKRLI